MRRVVISGRTASCTTTISASSGAACSASHTESWRVRPPATTVRDASFTTGSRIRRARATQGPGAATTTTHTAGWRAKWRTVAASSGAGPSRRNCFGVRAPNRLPTPPAGMTATTLGIGALRRRHGRRRCLVARAREDHSARRRLQHARHDHVERPADVSPALLDDDHRAVVEVPNALTRLLALAENLDGHRLAGEHYWLHCARQLVDVQHGHAAGLRQLGEVVVVRDDLALARPCELEELPIHLFDADDLDLRNLDPEPGDPLEPAEHLEPAAAATALERVRRVGDPLELTQHKAGNDQGTIEEPRPADVGDPPVDDGRGIEDLVEPPAPARTGAASAWAVAPPTAAETTRTTSRTTVLVMRREPSCAQPSSASSASLTVATPRTSSGTFVPAGTLLFGTTARRKPSAAASFSLSSSPATARTSPVSPTSPSTTTSPGTGRSR